MNGHGVAYESQDISHYKEHFEKLKELGRGKFGIVYEVKKKKKKRGDRGGDDDLSLASKHVRFAAEKSRQNIFIVSVHISFFRARKKDVRDRILAEVDLLSRLQHPKIVAFDSAFVGPSEVVLVTEFLSGTK